MWAKPMCPNGWTPQACMAICWVSLLKQAPTCDARPDLAHWLGVCSSREEALRCAHVQSGISMTALAAELRLSVARVSQLIARAELQRVSTSRPRL